MSKKKTTEKKPLRLNNDLRKYIKEKVSEYRTDLSNKLSNINLNEEFEFKEMVNSIQVEDYRLDYYITNLIEGIFNEDYDKIFEHPLVKKFVELKTNENLYCYNDLQYIDTKEKYLNWLKDTYKQNMRNTLNSFKFTIKDQLINNIKCYANKTHLTATGDYIAITIINRISQGEITLYSLEELDTYIKDEVAKYVSD